MRVFLALPAYDEETALPGLFARLLATGPPHAVIIVDDGSRDNTPRILDEWSSRLPLHVIRHPANRGLGESIRDALSAAAALAAPDDAIVTMDADNTHSLDLVSPMLERLRQGSDLVIASRYRPGARVIGLGPLRLAMSHGARLLFRLLLPILGVRDYTSGFRAYRASLLQRLLAAYGPGLVTERGFTCQAEVLLKLRPMNPRISEVPMVLRYDLKGGPSKMNVLLAVLKTFWLAARFRLRAPRPEGSRPPR